MSKKTYKIIECLDNDGRNVLRLNRRNGRILARWRNDMPGQCGRWQWVREKKAVEEGYGDIAYDAIRLSLYRNGLSDFCPTIHAPELKDYELQYIVNY